MNLQFRGDVSVLHLILIARAMDRLLSNSNSPLLGRGISVGLDVVIFPKNMRSIHATVSNVQRPSPPVEEASRLVRSHASPWRRSDFDRGGVER